MAITNISYLEERVNFHCRLCNTGESSLGTLASTSQTSQCTRVIRDVVLSLPLKLVFEVVQKGIVEVLTPQVSITSRGLHCENATSDVEKRNIESSSPQIEDENILFSLGLFIETVGNGSSCGFVDDT